MKLCIKATLMNKQNRLSYKKNTAALHIYTHKRQNWNSPQSASVVKTCYDAIFASTCSMFKMKIILSHEMTTKHRRNKEKGISDHK